MTTPATLGTKFEYSVDLSNAEANASVAIEATASVAGSVVTVKKGNMVLASAATTVNLTGDDTVDIDEGDNTITVEVLPLSFVAAQKKTYTLTINRARRNASDDARLSSLRVSSGMLMPAFDSSDLPAGDGTSDGSRHLFTVSVPHNIVEITVMAGTIDSRAKWEITDPADSDTTRSGHQVDVTGTQTEIDITVTAEDRTEDSQKYYQITVTRALVNASTDATLNVLTVTPGMTTPATLGTKFEYSVDLSNAEANASVAIEATASVAGSVVTVKKGNMVLASAVTTVNLTGDDTVDIDEGDNTITVEVLPPSFVAAQKKTYTLTINRARRNASDDGRLSSLSLRGGMLMPAFDASNLPSAGNADGTSGSPYLYTASVPNSVESLTVLAETMNSSAMVSVSITYGDAATPVSGGAVDLVIGPNVINIAVTAENRTEASKKYYRVTVTRASSGASTDATLNVLTVTPGMTTPATLGTKFEYSVDLSNAEANASVAIEATASVAGSVVTVKKGNMVLASAATTVNLTGDDTVDIDEGDNTITVEVLPLSFVAAQKKTYTLTINRAGRSASDDGRLSSLSLRGGMLMPAFDASNLPSAGNADGTSGSPYLYTARVPNSVESLTVLAETMNSSAMVSITYGDAATPVSGGAVDLVVGPNVINIAVTAENRTEASKKYYRVTVTRVAATASSNAALATLMLEDPIVTLDPAFDPANLPALMDGAHQFSASVSRGSGKIRVAPGLADTNATVIVMSSTTDGVIDPVDPPVVPPAYDVDLEVGNNVITVMVMAADVMTTKTYKITINRAGTGAAAALSDLSLSGTSLNESFGTAADNAYTADVAEGVESTTVTATTVQGNATVSIMPDDDDPDMAGHQVALTTGSNTITITVTDGDNTQVYRVTVTVASHARGELFATYDADQSNHIDLSEVNTAIDDFFAGGITLAQVNDVIDFFFE